ncbi:hypothetical protein SprV_0301144500 [Sparganum proliferum]
MVTSPPDENVVQQLLTMRSEVHSGRLLPCLKAEEGIGQEEAVFNAGSQEKETVVVEASDSLGTQHYPSFSTVSPDADVEVTKGN